MPKNISSHKSTKLTSLDNSIINYKPRKSSLRGLLANNKTIVSSLRKKSSKNNILSKQDCNLSFESLKENSLNSFNDELEKIPEINDYNQVANKINNNLKEKAIKQNILHSFNDKPDEITKISDYNKVSDRIENNCTESFSNKKVKFLQPNCDISFFNDESINNILNSYIKNPDEKNISLLECVDIERKSHEGFKIIDCDRIERIASLVKDNCRELGISHDFIEPSEIGIENALNEILLKIRTRVKTPEFMSKNMSFSQIKNTCKRNIEEHDKPDLSLIHLQDLLSQKEILLANEQAKTVEYRRIEISLRSEIDDLSKKLIFEQNFLKHTQERLKDYEHKIDNNTFLFDNIEKLGNIHKESTNDYVSELNERNEEIKSLKKENNENKNKISDMEIVIEKLMNKMRDKKEYT